MRPRALATTVALAVLLTIASPAGAQEYQPTGGQEGKDVVWVPTPPELVTAMLDMAQVGPDDYVIDLGSGDGRIVIAAAKRGARALGIEYNPEMVELSKKNAEKEGVSEKAGFMRMDIFETDFRSASVITMYLLPGLILRLRPQLLDLKPGTRIVSHAFSMDDWEADEISTAEERTAYALSRKEIASFRKYRPSKYGAYLSMSREAITTWLEDKLATVTSMKETARRSYMGKVYSYRAEGINKLRYRGVGTKGGYTTLIATKK